MSNTTAMSGAAASWKAQAPVSGSVDSKAVSRRLQQELMQLMMSKNKDATAFPDGDNLFEWVGTITGSAGTVYEGCTYKLRLKFGGDYPYKAPTITFTTPMWHPNVDTAGNICLDILKDQWSAALSVGTVLLSLQSLLGEPNPASPLNTQAAQQWANQTEYRRLVVQKYKEAGCGAPTSGWGSKPEDVWPASA